MPARRLTMVITELDPGGAERAFVQIATRLHHASTGVNDDRWSVHAICIGPEAELAAPLREAGVSVECLELRSAKSAFKLGRLRSAIRRSRPDLIQSFLFHANVASRLASIGIGAPVVSGHRVAERAAGWHIRLDRLTGRWATHHVAVSRSVANFLVENGLAGPSAVTVIPNGVDFERFSAAAPIARSELEAGPGPLLLHVGRLEPQKGLDRLLPAFARVLQSSPDATLLIVGDGADRELLETQAADLQVAGSIRWLGRRTDVERLYATADLFVLASRWEGMPNVVLEAAAAGCPVVTADVEGVREILGDDTGWVVPVDVGDFEITFASTISEALANAEARKRKSSAAQTVVEERFRWDAAARQYLDLYRTLASKAS